MTRRLPLIAFLAIAASLQATAQAPVNAQSAYEAKDWKTCAVLYGEQADRPVPLMGASNEAVRCLALAGEIDGAFKRLESTLGNQLSSSEDIAKDSDLLSLHQDPRWHPLLNRLKAEQIQREAHYDHALIKELKTRMTRDQDVRNRVLSDDTSQALWDEVTQVDIQNTAWLESVIEKQGWPLVSQVGRSGANDAWLLAQHADRAPAFQEKVLSLMQAAVSNGEAAGQLLAYLTDRVRNAQGKPQVYGTQFSEVDGMLEPNSIEDIAQVDARRAAVGLNTMADYVRTVETMMHRKMRWPPAASSGN